MHNLAPSFWFVNVSNSLYADLFLLLWYHVSCVILRKAQPTSELYRKDNRQTDKRVAKLRDHKLNEEYQYQLISYLLTVKTYCYRSLDRRVTGPDGYWSDIYVEFNDQVNIITW